MRKALVLLLLFVFCRLSGTGIFCLYAQESDDEYPEYEEGVPFESDWDWEMPDLYSRGDQAFSISLGLIFPLFFTNFHGDVIKHNFSPPVGGTGSLSYIYFLNSNFFTGGEIGVKFNATLGQNMIFLIPLGVRAGWQFIFGRFEIPLSLTVGPAFQRYLENGYIGWFLKFGGAGFYRFNPDWSFGLNADWSWYPQRIKNNNGDLDKTQSIHGNIFGVTITARYHF